jgi:hypothetical protein
MRSWLNTGEMGMGIRAGRKWCRVWCWLEYLGSGCDILVHHNKKQFGCAKQGLTRGYPESSDIPCLRSRIAERSHCARGVELRSVAMGRSGMCGAEPLRRRSDIAERSHGAQRNGAEPVRCKTVTTIARCREL